MLTFPLGPVAWVALGSRSIHDGRVFLDGVRNVCQ